MPARTMGLNLNSTPPSFAFTFRARPPSAPLSFSPRSIPNTLAAHHHSHHRHDNHTHHRKRKCDADTGGPIRKKRRIRLALITSRLSLPYSVPPTHIVDRGRSRIAVWAKQKALGRSLLRKAAILNRVQRRVEQAVTQSPDMAAERREETQLLRHKGIEMTRLARLRGSLSTVNSTMPVGVPVEAVDANADTPVVSAVRSSPNFSRGSEGVRECAPLPPSPLGLSNYDALDLEDTEFENEAGDWDDQADEAAPASNPFDFVAGATDSVFLSEYDRLDDLGPSSALTPTNDGNELSSEAEIGSMLAEHGVLPPETDRDHEEESEDEPHTPSPPDERLVEMMQEKERQRQILFLDLPGAC